MDLKFDAETANISNIRICKNCKTAIDKTEIEHNYSICPLCGHYMRVHAEQRIQMLTDDGYFEEWSEKNVFYNPLMDLEYQRKLEEDYEKHNLKDAVVIGKIKMNRQSVAIGVMDSRFMMASMGKTVGEKITYLFENATKKKMPVLLFCCSGGARMQEGIISLMQMEKTAAAVEKHNQAGLLYISVLTNPTMGGVTASFATLADIILAEKGATIGFAGRRVIEQNTGEVLTEEFQTAEFQLEHGFIDDIVDRVNMKSYLSKLIKMHTRSIENDPFKRIKGNAGENYMANKEDCAWEKVQIARMRERPTSLRYIDNIFDDFVELHGDRVLADDRAIVGGIAYFGGTVVTIIGNEKGKRSISEAVYRNFGMASPSGYRKALRLMKQAEKFNRPVICFVDTIGAACGKEAEEKGQGNAIAKNLSEMSKLKVPILSIIIGEGGSGGALALGVGNEVWMLENSVYSVLTPEGYASIIWKDNNRAKDAAQIMKLRAGDLYEMGVIDKVIVEKTPVSNENMENVCRYMNYEIAAFLQKYRWKTKKYIVKQRYQRFRRF